MEMQNSQHYNYKIINDELEDAIIELERIIKTERLY
jgi:guanylate kinase